MVPPDGIAVACPVAPPLQSIFIPLAVADRASAGSVNVVLADVVQPCASVTVTVYVPAVKPVAVMVVCTGVVLQV